MNKKQLKDLILRSVPNIKLIRRGLSKIRYQRTFDQLLSENQIKAGEQSRKEKARLVQMYLTKNNKLVKNTKKNLNKLIHDLPSYRERKDWKDLRADILFCCFAYGFQPDEYLCFELEEKNAEERKKFVSDVLRYRYVYRMNDSSEAQIFNNKGYTYKRFHKYFKRDAVYLCSENDYGKFRDFISKHSEFVRKAVYEGMGRSVELVDIKSCRMSESEIFHDMISKGPHIVEERVKQSSIMSQLNASSVNTIRSFTFNTRHGIKMPYFFIKMGRNGSFVDNAGAGGIVVGIDPETGKLCTNGYDELNRQYERHPDSGVILKGFQIPEWEKLKKLSEKMSSEIPDVKFIGWDLAHTENGWVVIEGNGMSQLIIPQIVFKRGIRAEVEALMNDMDLIV